MSVAQQRIQAWRKSALLFVQDNFKPETIDEWQREALELASAGDPRLRVVLRACTGPGKTVVLSWLGWWRLSCFAERGEHPKGAALSVTFENLKANLWPELSKWQQRSAFLTAAFTWTKELIYANDHPSTWFLSARSFARDADAEAIGRALSGLHSLYPFVLLDETGDMPVAVVRAAEQIFTGAPRQAAIFAAGNPTSTDGLLYHLCTQVREQWKLITITADPDDPRRTPRVDIELAREQIRLYGRDNPWVMATILGKFPPGGFNALLTLDEVELSMSRVLRVEAYDWSQRRLGVDQARFGDDRTVIFPRQGLMALMPIEMRGANSLEVAARVVLAKSRWHSDMELFDGTGGWASGSVDSMRQAGHSPLEVNAAGQAQDAGYFNARSEMWFRMADWIKKGGCLPRVPGLARELTSPQYTFQDGKFRLEEKAQIKKRLGFSPDLADALAQTFYLPDMPRTVSVGPGIEITLGVDGYVGKKENADYDPLSAERMQQGQ